MSKIVLAVLMVLSVVIVSYGADQDSEKDWCLLGISNKCPSTTTLDLVDKTNRLEAAIKKGSAVYTVEELKHLQAKLEEAYYIKDWLFNKR